MPCIHANIGLFVSEREKDIMKNFLDKKQSNCAFSCNIKGCRVLSEKVCERKKCTFFMSHERLKHILETDYLFLSFQNGVISKERYIELVDRYHSGSKKIL